MNTLVLPLASLSAEEGGGDSQIEVFKNSLGILPLIPVGKPINFYQKITLN